MGAKNFFRRFMGQLTHILMRPISIAIVDLLSFFAAVNLIYRLRLDFNPPVIDLYVLGVGVVILLSQYLFDCFSLKYTQTILNLASKSIMAVLASGVFIAASIYITDPPIDIAIFWRGNLPLSLAVYSGYVICSRYIFWIIGKAVAGGNVWAFVGSDQRFNELVIRAREAGKPFSFRLLNDSDFKELLDDKLTNLNSDSGFSLPRADEVEIGNTWSQVVIDRETVGNDSQFSEVLVNLRFRGTKVISLDQMFEQEFGRISLKSIDEKVLIDPGSYLLRRGWFVWKLKRLADVFLSAIGLVFTSPIILIAFVAIRLSSKGSGFFKQERTGLFNKPFEIIKLRTMIHDAEGKGPDWTQLNDIRITKVGYFLRRFRIDELPQLWNVLVGDMSLIGPRPERPRMVQELIRDLPAMELRHIVRPGISGWAQVHSGYAASVEDWALKLEHDLYYIKNFSLLLDFFIVLKTFRVILHSEGR